MTLEQLQEAIRDAAANATPLRLRGGGSKDFYGNEPRGTILDTRGYAGIVSYEPTELVVTARCGTLLSELESVLDGEAQCLPFEPPHFGPEATLGGCVAAGLSGPRRASAGAVRDFVLGTKIVDGRGRLMSFGGQVMKNVAGYDVTRMLVGSLGTLALLAEMSVKVLPRPAAELSLKLEMPLERAIEAMNRWAARPLPITGTAWLEGELAVRLSGSQVAVRAAREAIGGAALEPAQGEAFWRAIREHTHPFFSGPEPLWRIALPSAARALGINGRTLIEWSGGLRWLKSTAGASAVRDAARALQGHATLFRAADKSAGAFMPLPPALARLHNELRAVFDPASILNPGRMYAER